MSITWFSRYSEIKNGGTNDYSFSYQIGEKVAVHATAWRFVLGLVLSALSGLMLLLALPPYGIWPLAWFGVVPVLLAQYRFLPAKWSSLAQAIFAAVWLGPFLARLFGAGYGPFFQYLGIWIAILNFFLAKDRRFHDLTKYRWFMFHGAINWVGFEMIRATFIPIIRSVLIPTWKETIISMGETG